MFLNQVSVAQSKRIFPLVLVLFLLAMSGSASAKFFVDASNSLSNSFRFDSFSWHEANNAAEYQWDELAAFQLQLNSEILFHELFYLKGSLGYGWIFGGDSHISENGPNNRVNQSLEIDSNASDGTVTDGSFALGMMFDFFDHSVGQTMLFMPLLGYSANYQNLTMNNSNISSPSPVGLSGNNSTYDARWYGPWIGFDFRFSASDTSALIFRYEYHDAEFYAESNLGYNSQLAHPTSLEQWSDGWGSVFALSIRSEFAKFWVLGLDFEMQNWSASGGLSRSYNANGSFAEADFGGAEWDSFAFKISVGYFSLGRR